MDKPESGPVISAALDAAPDAATFFDSLAQFNRTAWLRWIDSTKRHPEQRPVRIAEMVRLLQQGHKETTVMERSTAGISYPRQSCHVTRVTARVAQVRASTKAATSRSVPSDSTLGG